MAFPMSIYNPVTGWYSVQHIFINTVLFMLILLNIHRNSIRLYPKTKLLSQRIFPNRQDLPHWNSTATAYGNFFLERRRLYLVSRAFQRLYVWSGVSLKLKARAEYKQDPSEKGLCQHNDFKWKIERSLNEKRLVDEGNRCDDFTLESSSPNVWFN